MKKILKTAIVLSCLLLGSNTTNVIAQTWPPVSPGITPTLIKQHITQRNTEAVNCDMYEYDLSLHKTFYAVVWDVTDTTVPMSYLQVVDRNHTSGTGTALVTLPAGAKHPDVIIGDTSKATACSGNKYFIGVVYELNTRVFYRQYAVTKLVSGTLTVTPTAGAATLVKAGLSHVSSRYPHIDAFPDSADTCGTGVDMYYLMHKFVITWTEDTGTGEKVWATTGSLLTTPSFTPRYIDNGYTSDVAVSTNLSTGVQTAYFVYVSSFPVTSLSFANWNIATTTFNLIGGGIGYSVLKCPRIEAQSLDKTSAIPRVNWKTAENVSGSPSGILSHENAPGICLCATNWTPTMPATFQHMQPAIATGPGIFHPRWATGNYCSGDSAYTMGWYADDITGVSAPGTNTGPDGYQAAVIENLATTSTNNVKAGYLHVNTASVYAHNGIPTSGNFTAIGVSNCSNTGYALLAAYQVQPPGFGGSVGEIYAKWIDPQATGYAFKTTEVLSIPRDGSPGIFPNPAKDKLTVFNVTGTPVYSITDMTGRLLAKGKMQNAESNIDISGFAPGMYILNIHSNDKPKNIKFTKE